MNNLLCKCLILNPIFALYTFLKYYVIEAVFLFPLYCGLENVYGGYKRIHTCKTYENYILFHNHARESMGLNVHLFDVKKMI